MSKPETRRRSTRSAAAAAEQVLLAPPPPPNNHVEIIHVLGDPIAPHPAAEDALQNRVQQELAWFRAFTDYAQRVILYFLRHPLADRSDPRHDLAIRKTCLLKPRAHLNEGKKTKKPRKKKQKAGEMHKNFPKKKKAVEKPTPDIGLQMISKYGLKSVSFDYYRIAKFDIEEEIQAITQGL